MKRSKGLKLGTVLMALLLISTVVVPSVSGNQVKKIKIDESSISEDEIFVKDQSLLSENTGKLIKEALNDKKITAEELKLLIDNDLRIIVAEDTNVAFARYPDRDLIVPSKKKVQERLDELMREAYVQKHGFDPEKVGITPQNVTEEELEKMVHEGKVKINDAPDVTITEFLPPGDPASPPYAVNNKIYVNMYPAKDSAHAPSSSNYNDVQAAITPFENEFGVDMVIFEIYNEWDASNVGDNTTQLLNDLVADIPEQEVNDVIMGWVDNAVNNGMAQRGGYYSVCAEIANFPYANWPDDSAAQHELSHNFDAQDTSKSGGNCVNTCIMDYWDAFWGTDNWESYHWNIVNMGV